MNYIHEINYERYCHYDRLSNLEQKLVMNAQQAMQKAYAPYSRLKVGAALLLSDGTIIQGNNQENIAYPSGLCAERVALFYAGSNYPQTEVESMVIVAEGDLLKPSGIVSPCGACRQVMLETQKRQSKPFRVVLVGQKGNVLVFHSADDLLPFAFGV
jgi:cytidine deaminase